MKIPLPEKLKVVYVPKRESTDTLGTFAAKINQIIDCVAELTEVVEGKCCDNGNFGSEHNCLKHPPTLKETLLGEIIAERNKYKREKDDYSSGAWIALCNAEAIINRLLP